MPRHSNSCNNNAMIVYVTHLASPMPHTRRGRHSIENYNMPKRWKSKKKRNCRRRRHGSWRGKGFGRRGGMLRRRNMRGKEELMTTMVMKGGGRRRGIQRKQGGDAPRAHPVEARARVPSAHHHPLAASVAAAVHHILPPHPTPAIVAEEGKENLAGAAREVDAEGEATAVPRLGVGVSVVGIATRRVPDRAVGMRSTARRRMQTHVVTVVDPMAALASIHHQKSSRRCGRRRHRGRHHQNHAPIIVTRSIRP